MDLVLLTDFIDHVEDAAIHTREKGSGLYAGQELVICAGLE